MVTPKGFLNNVGDPCNFCRLLSISMTTNTIRSSNITAVSTPMMTSTKPCPSFLAATVTKLTQTHHFNSLYCSAQNAWSYQRFKQVKRYLRAYDKFQWIGFVEQRKSNILNCYFGERAATKINKKMPSGKTGPWSRQTTNSWLTQWSSKSFLATTITYYCEYFKT